MNGKMKSTTYNHKSLLPLNILLINAIPMDFLDLIVYSQYNKKLYKLYAFQTTKFGFTLTKDTINFGMLTKKN